MRETNESVGRELARTLGGYVTGQAKIAAILALLYAIGFAISGVPGWFLIGPVGGLLNIVPVVGGVVALLLAALAVFFADGTLYNYMGVLITFVLVQGFEGFYLTPRLLGRRTGLSAIAVFFSILVGGMFFGPIGVIAAVPVAAVAAVLIRRLFTGGRAQHPAGGR